LTAAIELARRGVRVRLIDRKSGPTPLSKAVGVAAHTLDLLAPSGVAARLLADGLRVTRGYIWSHGRRLGALDFRALPHRHNFLLSLPQSETETIMAETLEQYGVTVEWGRRLVALNPGSDRIEVLIEDQRGRTSARYPIVFGADGTESAVRAGVDLPFEGITHRRVWSIADAEIPDWPYEDNAAQVFLYRGGHVGFIIPIGAHRFRAVSNTPDALAHVPGAYTANVLRRDTFHIPARQTPTYQVGGVYLGGDAAHAHSPLGARGMNLGIEDAVMFAQLHSEDRLARYTEIRHPIAKDWIALSERAVSVVQSTNAAIVAARDVVLSIFGHAPVLQTPLLKRVSGLSE
jgi:2-polyprenyl-6-methoxyphenol hydroxylase-like FAD-dependent oxidoreductase